MIKPLYIAILGVVLSGAMGTAPAQAQVFAYVSVESFSANPCVEGSCRVAVRDMSSSSSGSEPYTVRFDCDRNRHGSFTSDSGGGRPPRSGFTCSYADAGQYTIEMQVSGPGGTDTDSRDIQVASKADEPGVLNYQGPSSFALPGTFEAVTPKRFASARIYAGGQSGAAFPLGKSFDGRSYHHRFRIWIAPVGRIRIALEAYNSSLGATDRRTVFARVTRSSPFPKSFRPRVKGIRTKRRASCQNIWEYFAARAHTARLTYRFQALVRKRGVLRWKTFRRRYYRKVRSGRLDSVLVQDKRSALIPHRYRRKSIRCNVLARVTKKRKARYRRIKRTKPLEVVPIL